MKRFQRTSMSTAEYANGVRQRSMGSRGRPSAPQVISRTNLRVRQRRLTRSLDGSRCDLSSGPIVSEFAIVPERRITQFITGTNPDSTNDSHFLQESQRQKLARQNGALKRVRKNNGTGLRRNRATEAGPLLMKLCPWFEDKNGFSWKRVPRDYNLGRTLGIGWQPWMADTAGSRQLICRWNSTILE